MSSLVQSRSIICKIGVEIVKNNFAKIVVHIVGKCLTNMNVYSVLEMNLDNCTYYNHSL